MDVIHDNNERVATEIVERCTEIDLKMRDADGAGLLQMASYRHENRLTRAIVSRADFDAEILTYTKTSG